MKRVHMALGLLACLLAIPVDANALIINGENSADNYRFSSGYPGTPVPNSDPDFLAADYDLSGVGWGTDANRSYVMISDQYFVYATHYPPTDTNMYFFSPTNGKVLYTIDGSFSLTLEYPFSAPGNHLKTDLSVGRLTSALNTSDNITSYPILDLPSGSDYLGLNLLVYGWTAAVGTGVINGLGPVNLYWNNSTPALASDDVLNTPTNFDNLNDTYVMSFTQGIGAGEALAEGGDSGSPSFVLWAGGLALAGIHSAVQGSTTYDTFLPAYLETLDNQGIPFSTVPEPSILLLLIPAGLVCLTIRKKNRGVSPL